MFMLLASPGGTSLLYWRELVEFFSLAISGFFSSANRIFHAFTTPIIQLADELDIGLSSVIVDLVVTILNFFGAQFVQLTPLQLMFGSMFPAIIIFSLYGFFKR